jgi:hypothetical protein
MGKRSQLSFEYLILVGLGIAALTLTTYYANTLVTSKNVENSVRIVVSQISDAAETVALMGYPARQTFNVYVPTHLEPNSTYVINNTVNFGVHQEHGVNDVFETFDFCIKGNLPVSEGYYVISVLSLGDCVLVGYEDLYVSPDNVYKLISAAGNATVNFDVINLLLGPVNLTITANNSIASLSDVDALTPGRQNFYYYGTVNSGETIVLAVTFYGDSSGLYTGSLYFNDFEVPVILNVTSAVYNPPSITNTQVNTTTAYVNDYVCFNASVTQGTLGISSVWAQITNPTSTAFNYSMSDTGCPCCGTTSDGVYGGELELSTAGLWTVNTSFVNDTSDYVAFQSPYPNLVVNVSYPVMLVNYTVFFEDFTPSPYYNYNWTRLGTDWDSVSGGNCYGGAGDCAHADGNCDETNDWISTNAGLINLTSANNVFVDLYVREDNSFDAGEYFRVWCWNGASWVKIYEEDTGAWTSNGAWRHREFTASPTCFIANARFRITIQSNNKNEDVHVDDFRVVKES